MDFDFQHIAVPFRMQPGLARLAPGRGHLTPLAPDHPLHAHKEQLVQAGGSRLCVPGFDPQPALEAIAQQARREGLALEGPLELAFEEDFAILDGATGTLPWLCVCAPSHWAPEDKLGLSLAAVHAPVADNAMLQAGAAHLVRLATGGERWERWVWTISPCARHDQHPRRHPPTPWPDTADPIEFAQACWLRVERQTFLPVPGLRQAVFTIRVQLQPLAQAVATAAVARRLHDSLASMTDAVLAYKNLAAAKPRLLSWLAFRAGTMASQSGNGSSEKYS